MLTAITYGIDKTVNIRPDFGMDSLGLGKGIVLLHIGVGLSIKTYCYSLRIIIGDLVVKMCRRFTDTRYCVEVNGL